MLYKFNATVRLNILKSSSSISPYFIRSFRMAIEQSWGQSNESIPAWATLSACLLSFSQQPALLATAAIARSCLPHQAASSRRVGFGLGHRFAGWSAGCWSAQLCDFLAYFYACWLTLFFDFLFVVCFCS